MNDTVCFVEMVNWLATGIHLVKRIHSVNLKRSLWPHWTDLNGTGLDNTITVHFLCGWNAELFKLNFIGLCMIGWCLALLVVVHLIEYILYLNLP